jgi:large subunit ribosomal protein L25
LERKALTVTTRSDGGKGVARKLRASGYIPGIVYGTDEGAQSISVAERDLLRVFRESASSNIIVDITIEGMDGEPKMAIVKEIQKEPVDGSIVHIDFQLLTLGKKLNVDIPLKITGTPVGVKNSGGILEFIHRRIHVASLPKDIDEYIEIDVSDLEIGDSIHASSLDLPKYDLLTNPNQVLVTVAAPTISKELKVALAEGEEGEELEGEEAAEGEEETTEPEVITEKKKDE